MHSRTKLLEFIELAKAKGYPLTNAIKIKDLFLSFVERQNTTKGTIGIGAKQLEQTSLKLV
jgi:hypothetical protein